MCPSMKNFPFLTCKVLVVALGTGWGEMSCLGTCSSSTGPAVLLLSTHSVSTTSLPLWGAVGLKHEHAAVEQSGKYYWSVVCKGRSQSQRNKQSFLSCRGRLLPPPVLLYPFAAQRCRRKGCLSKDLFFSPLLNQHSSLSQLSGSFMKSLCRFMATS